MLFLKSSLETCESDLNSNDTAFKMFIALFRSECYESCHSSAFFLHPKQICLSDVETPVFIKSMVACLLPHVMA